LDKGGVSSLVSRLDGPDGTVGGIFVVDGIRRVHKIGLPQKNMMIWRGKYSGPILGYSWTPPHVVCMYRLVHRTRTSVMRRRIFRGACRGGPPRAVIFLAQ
jgi:hypothetical protein